jgi:hypothetical protein
MQKQIQVAFVASVLMLGIAACSAGSGSGSTPFGNKVDAPASGGEKSVTLNWSPPASNTDGSPLTDLSGYKVFYGTASRQYFNALSVPDAHVASAVIGGLAPGHWYFSVKSVSASGVESDYSGEVEAML